KLIRGDNVKTRPQASQHIENGQITVGLDRITHQMRAILQGLIVGTIVTLQRRPGIDVGLRTKALGDFGNGNVFGVEFAVTVIEVVHAVPESLRSGVVWLRAVHCPHRHSRPLLRLPRCYRSPMARRPAPARPGTAAPSGHSQTPSKPQTPRARPPDGAQAQAAYPIP